MEKGHQKSEYTATRPGLGAIVGSQRLQKLMESYIRNGAALTTIGSGQKMHTSYAETMFSYSVGTIFAMLSGKLLLPQLTQKLSGLEFGPPFCQFWLRFEKLRAYK